MALLCFGSFIAHAQKPVINNDTYKSWIELRDYHISDDGRYVLYNYGGEAGGDTKILQSTQGAYKKVLDSLQQAWFIDGGNYVLFIANKKAGILKCGEDTLQYIPNASELKYCEAGGRKWIFFLREGNLLQRDLQSSTIKSYNDITKYWLNETGGSLLYFSKNKLTQVDIGTGKEKVIYTGPVPDDITFDQKGQQLCFLLKGEENKIFYFKAGGDSAIAKITSGSRSIKKGFYVADEPPRFTEDGSAILLRLGKETAAPAVDTTVIAANVDIWNYKDAFLQSNQAFTAGEIRNRKYAAAFNLYNNNLIQIENQDTMLASSIGSRYALVRPSTFMADMYWNPDLADTYDLLSIRDGKRKTIASNQTSMTISPNEQFVCWFDTISKHYYTYEIKSGITRNISDGISGSLINPGTIAKVAGPIGTAGWLKNDGALLIYDQYDIWQVDPSAKKRPVNLTKSFGSKHKILLRAGIDEDKMSQFELTSQLLLAALDQQTKRNGFFTIQLNQENELTDHGLDDCLYFVPNIYVDHPRAPLKARNSNEYLVTRQTAREAPNVFITDDFKHFKQLSSIAPQANYNWLTAEIHHWPLEEGGEGTGILYKPENFDSSKTYPIIYNYYELRSNELNRFWSPELPNGQLSIPWYVSNGYLVFIPDISFRAGEFSSDLNNIISSSVAYLKQYKWVDTKRMGIQGHSFAGYITNILAAQTNLFAAAQSTAGLSDMIVEYAGLGFGGKSLIEMTEEGQLKMGSPPWAKPDMYKANSVLYTLDKMTTPILLVHNKEDGAVPFAHSLLLFNSLRRLNKPVWMLQYDGEEHVLSSTPVRLDYSIRQQQFFNHYLKDGPLPGWMKAGVPYSSKGIRSGLNTR
ncbi:peptidase S9 prolyl oligopeptidase active site domain protein [Chitinophaga pinensis DSM 2588]|uniref:Peptidase S9 prolyl oligopeptidase active site domain protein n=2 Tax=Chitinophaga pinensis TaxID=79329 RepID=A0A979GPN1_CHIPD|nr:peptidase S9 prolyl oligopeptidase active site domain protein [Chitinophaga pinensis DSM 2588]